MMRFFLILFALILTACASTPDPQIHSYFLELKDEAKPDAIKIGVIDVKVQVAHYLAQPGIVLQTGPNQLTAAHYHRWAEPLTVGVRRVLARQLNVNSSFEPGMMVSVELFRFHGTRDGKALAAGHWSIYDDQKQQPRYQQAFDLKQPLSQAGYGALVQTLSALLDSISHDITTHMVED